MQMYVLGKKRRGGHHKEYIFFSFCLPSLVECPSVCPLVLYEHTDVSYYII